MPFVLYNSSCCSSNSRVSGGIAQLVEHPVHTRVVICSSQIAATRPGGQKVKTPPFHGGNMGSIPVRVTMIAEHYRWNGKKASRFKVFGNFLFSKFFGNSIDEIAACRGSNRIWTSVFPYSSGFSVAAPFFRGLRRLNFGKIEEKSFTKLWALDCWFSRTND